MFRRHSRDYLHEARVLDLKEAHAAEVKQLMRLVDMLAEQVDYLRSQMGRPSMAKVASVNPTQQPPAMEGFVPFLSDEEEDLHALHEAGHFSKRELEEALEKAGFPSPEVTVES